MTHILVTGGAGFIGSNFVRMALRDELPGLEGVDVTVLDSLTYSGNPANLDPVSASERYRFVQGDIRDAELVRELVAAHDALIHFAAESHVDRSVESGSEFFSTNVLGTVNLLEASIASGLARFVHVSTDEVYGTLEAGSWRETHILEPNSPYSASKAGSDLAVRAYGQTHGLDHVITRCSNNYGPYQYPEKLIPLFITNLIDGLPVPLYGDGGNIRDWLHVDDHCRGIALALTRGMSGQIYNIGGGTELSNRELTALLLELTDRDWSFVEPVQDRKGHDRRYSVDIDKAQRELGYHPEVDFTQGLMAVRDWYRDNRAWWKPLTS